MTRAHARRCRQRQPLTTALPAAASLELQPASCTQFDCGHGRGWDVLEWAWERVKGGEGGFTSDGWDVVFPALLLLSLVGAARGTHGARAGRVVCEES